MHEETNIALNNILDSIYKIESRFTEINTADDFINSDAGVTIYDSINMRLQVIGEQIRNIEKYDSALLENYTDINWKGIIALRNIISHDYNFTSYEVIFNLCKEKLPELKSTIHKILTDSKGS